MIALRKTFIMNSECEAVKFRANFEGFCSLKRWLRALDVTVWNKRESLCHTKLFYNGLCQNTKFVVQRIILVKCSTRNIVLCFKKIHVTPYNNSIKTLVIFDMLSFISCLYKVLFADRRLMFYVYLYQSFFN